MKGTLVDVAGWAGAVVVLSAYALVSTGRMPYASRRNHLLNVAGAALVGLNAWHYRALPSFAIEAVWVIFALIAMARTAKVSREQWKP